MSKVYLICPVRGVLESEKKFLDNYVSKLEKEGFKVHYPPRDTKQDDVEKGFNICNRNYKAIIEADEIHYYYNNKSNGSFFDFGIAFSEYKNKKKLIKLINKEEVLRNIKNSERKKGFEFVALKIDEKSKIK